MRVEKINELKSKMYKKYVKKLKPIILNILYDERIHHNCIDYGIYLFYHDSKTSPYMRFDNSVIDDAISELENETKISHNKTSETISLTDSMFKELNSNKSWFKSHIFDIISSAIGLWGAITGTLALFFK